MAPDSVVAPSPFPDINVPVASVDEEQLDNIFRYHAPDEVQIERYSELRAYAKAFARSILRHCPASADRTAALRKVREAVMTANASIALGGKAF